MRLADRLLTPAFKVLPHVDRRNEVERAKAILERFGLPPDTPEDELRRVIERDPETWMQSIDEDNRKEVHLKRELAKSHASMQGAIGKLLKLSTVVVAQNVYRWIRDTDAILDIYSMPCLAPKREVMWTEWAQDNGQAVGVFAILDGTDPEEIYPRGKLNRPDGQPVLVDEIREATVEGLEQDDINNNFEAYEHFWTSNNLPDVAAWDAVHWVWRVSMYSERGRDVYGPIITWHLAIDPNGKCLDMAWAIHAPVDEHELVEETIGIVNVWAQTLSFMNCRNVQTVYRTPSPGEQKKHRKKRKGEHPLLGYNLIQIQPTGKAVVNRSAGAGDDERAFHIAGGSIAHYGNCCPGTHPTKGLLFGKLEGIYYRPPHVKGNPRHGVVASDYEVQAPR